MARPLFKDREMVKRVCKIMLLPALRELALKIGSGNISHGVAIALMAYEVSTHER